MSLNIPDALLRCVSEVRIDVSLGTLGPRQRKALDTMCRTGFIKGESVPALLAKHLLNEQAMPYLHIKRYKNVAWNNLTLDTAHPFRAALISCGTAAALKHGSQDGYRATSIQATVDRISADYMYGIFNQHILNNSLVSPESLDTSGLKGVVSIIAFKPAHKHGGIDI